MKIKIEVATKEYVGEIPQGDEKFAPLIISNHPKQKDWITINSAGERTVDIKELQAAISAIVKATNP